MKVIGTAGHVDHGKSTLVEKLTGINPDRLQEEQSRKLTIDLGFAWMTLPNNEKIGIIDVPGHRDFIENMLAGVGGIDLALLIIACDEGVMPQTREHVAIVDLLGIENAIVVLTKADLIDDPEWIELVALEVEELLSTTQISNAPIIPVSAITGSGLDRLIETLQSKLGSLPERTNFHRPRLPIDRTFSVSGFGTIVTGTLSGGTLNVGDNVEIQPSGKVGRIRGLQSYKQELETAFPGSRVAINLAGLDKDDVRRGDVVTYPGHIHPTVLVDVYFNHLADANRPLFHNTEVKFFSGASESIANVRLLNYDKLLPGSHGWLQLRLRDELPLSRGDRFIMRYPSPAETIGGGTIVNPHPSKRWKRFQPDVIHDLELRLDGTPAERLAQLAEGTTPFKRRHLQELTDFSETDFQKTLDIAIQEDLIQELDTNLFWATPSYQRVINQLLTEVSIYHNTNPLRLGISRAELQSRLNLKLNLLDTLIDRVSEVTVDNDLIRLRDHQIEFSESQENKIEELFKILESNPYQPPSIDELNEIASEAVVRALTDIGKLVVISSTIAFSKPAYNTLVTSVLEHLEQHQSIDAKTLRDKFNTSRKYAIATLEHLDSLGITRRIGDTRQRGQKSPQL